MCIRYNISHMQRRLLLALPLILLSAFALANPTTTTRASELWSLAPVRFPTVPQPKDAAWVRNPIDAFVLSMLEAQGLKPSPEADRRTLIRRVTFDLTGLPPTPEEIAAFLADTRPDAYEHLVDRLLASPHYGERWARRWLDVARFGESHGYEYDHLRDNAWRYRDWVVQSLNADMPYDEFVREQVAGDVLPGAGEGGVIATGFLVAGPMDEAGKASAGVQVRLRAREEELEDMVGLVGQTFVGLTTNCARCHDHKFDPIPTKDYYRLKAALAGVQPGNRSALSAEQDRRRNVRLAELRRKLTVCQTQIMAIEEPIRRRLIEQRSGMAVLPGPTPTYRWTFTEQGGRLSLDGKGARFQSPPLETDIREKTLEAWVSLTDLEQHGGSVLTLETEGGTQFDGIVFGERQRGKWVAGSEFYNRTSDLEANPETEVGLVQVAITYHADGRIQFYRNGILYGASYQPETTVRVYPAGKSHVLIGPRHTGSGDFLKGVVSEARIYNRALSAEEVNLSFRNAPFTVPMEEVEHALSPENRTKRDALQSDSERYTAEIKAQETPPQTYAANSQQPVLTYVLPRGDIQAQGELVSAGGLSAVSGCSSDFGLSPDAPEAQRRVALARWLTNTQNPLTARVIVNRIWQGHFGRGIVGTPNDFGNNGEHPTHPALLDWLATTFSGPGEWRIKRLHRLILLSSTYRQSSVYNAKAASRDAENRLLWRFAPQRLEAEAIRDSMLAVSGKLNPALGGPSFRPFTVTRYGSDFYELVDKDTPEFNRRSLYRMAVQSARSPLLETLDCPDPSTKTPRRTVTTTPTQALALMNDSFVLRQSRTIATRVQSEAGSAPDRQINRVYALTLGRLPTSKERDRAIAHLKIHPLDSLCWALVNSSEFIYVK